MTNENFQGINIKGGNNKIKDNTFIFHPTHKSATAVKYIPHTGICHFVGRSAELTKIHEKLHGQNNTVAISAVAGMGGVGKTELAVKYAREHENDYPGGICWFNVRESSIAASIIEFAQNYLELEVPQQNFSGKQLTPKQQVDWCWQNWQPPAGLVLIVFDDVTKLENFTEYLPRNNRFRLLMTTRLRNIDANIEEVALDVLSSEEALKFLQAIIGNKRVQKELATAKNLCSWLGYLPLGIELVGRYLQEDPDLSLAEICERLENTRISDEALLGQQSTLSTAQRGVKAAFELSWEELNAKTQYIAQYISLFAPAPFTWEWLKSINENYVQHLGWDKQDLQPAKKHLYKLHFIQRLEEPHGYYKIHPLIRDFLQNKLNLETEATKIKSIFVQPFVELAQQIPDRPTRDFIFSISLGIPHLEEVAKSLNDVVADEDLTPIFLGVAKFYDGQGLYALAEASYNRCLEKIKGRLGEEHPAFAASLNSLALLYNSQGRYSEAEPLLKQALGLYKRVLGEEHADFARNLNNLAILYNSQGRYSDAEPLFKQALELKKQVLGKEHPSVAISLSNLALLYSSQKRYKDAELFYQQALSLIKRVLGEENLDFAVSLNNLAHLYYLQENYTDAEPLFKQALELRKRLLGEEHPDFAQSLNNLANLYNSQGYYSDAEPLLKQALALTKRLSGEENPGFTIILNSLASLYGLQRRYSDAEPLLKQALALTKRVLGEEHPDFAQSLNNLANLYKSQGRYSDAEPLLKQVLELTKRLLGEEHLDFAISLNNLANLYKSQGRYSDAESLLKQVLELTKRLLGEEHPGLAIILNNLANLYNSQGRYSEAEPLYQKVLLLFKQVLGEENPYFSMSLNNLANLYNLQGHYSEAEPLYQQALLITERTLGENHPSTVPVRKNLENVLAKIQQKNNHDS
ncbi:NB-ARC domain-containing protein [Calothrix sp. PCC 7716]|nr:NB-ARC domain-containing protein [Calothrix sp. PCC 7716]